MEKSKIKKLIAVVGVAIIALTAIIIIIVNDTTKVSLKEYVSDEIVYNGINGYGFIEADEIIDEEALTNAIIGGAWDFESVNDEEYFEYGFSKVGDYLEYELSENNGTLSNGDTVTLTVSIDKDGMKNNPFYKKKLSGKDTQTFKFKVDGLKEGVAIDVFDAVDYFYLNTTGFDIYDYTVLKEDYVKEYSDGITVKVENDRIKVYGDDFYSFTVDIEPVTDNYDENTEKLKLGIDCESTKYIENGLVLAPSVKEFDVEVISWVDDGDINTDDIKILKNIADAEAKKLFDTNKFKLTEINHYFYESKTYGGSNMLNFYYSDGSSIYTLTFNDLVRTRDGRICGVEDEEIDYETDWWTGKIKARSSIEEFEKLDMVYNTKYQITIPK